jgi:hypothetical protein
MRIVAWNCNMAFDRKVEDLLALRLDVAVISECAGACHRRDILQPAGGVMVYLDP